MHNRTQINGSLIAIALLVMATVGFGQTAKIMPLGDSLTRGNNDINYPNGNIPGGYRRGLGEQLTSAGYSFDFVGSQTDNAFPGMDPNHNGREGFRTDEILANLANWLVVDPDTVLLHAGTNDILQDVPVATAINHLNSVIGAITANDSTRRLYVATIIPIMQAWPPQAQTYSAAYLNGNVNAYNAQLRILVQQYADQGRKVFLVEMNGGIVLTNPNPALNFYQPGDGLHPGQAGYNQMGAIWFNAITASGSLLPTTYQSWAASYPAFVALPVGEQLPLADANQDGFSNLLAYAFNLNPLEIPPQAARPKIVVNAGAASFQFRCSKTAGAMMSILVSSDLSASGWQIQSQAGAVVTPVSGDTNAELVTVPLGAVTGRKFARLRVILN